MMGKEINFVHNPLFNNEINFEEELEEQEVTDTLSNEEEKEIFLDGIPNLPQILPEEPIKGCLQKEEKEETTKWFNQLKKKPIHILKVEALNSNISKWILFLNSNFGSINNLLKHLLKHEESKEQVVLFLKQVNVSLPEEKEKAAFTCGISHSMNTIKKHFRNISPLIRNLPGMTEDLYQFIRKVLSCGDTSSPLFISENVLIPKLYSARYLFELSKRGKVTISVKELYIPTLEEMVTKEKIDFKYLTPQIFHQKIKISPSKEYLNVFHELWQHFGLLIFQIEKMKGIKSSINGTIVLDILCGIDGSVIKGAGRQVLCAFAKIFFNSNYFISGVEQILKTPLPTYVLLGPETKLNTQNALKKIGAQICDLERFCCKIRENLCFNFQFKQYTGDGSDIWKFFCVSGGKSPHRCPYCTACFSEENKLDLLNQIHLNSKTTIDLKQIEEWENNDNKIQLALSKSNIINVPFEERQTSVLIEQMERKDPINVLKGISFAVHGSGILCGSNFNIFINNETTESFSSVNLLKRWVKKFGGTFIEKKKENAKFIFSNLYMAKKTLNNPKHKYHNNTFLSIRFLPALVFGFSKIENFEHFKFTRDTKEIDSSTCPCVYNKFLLEPKSYPTLAVGYWERLEEVEPNKEETINIYSNFINRVSSLLESLHANKSFQVTIWELMINLDIMNLRLFKKTLGGKKNKNPSQCSGTAIRNIVCGYKSTIMKCLNNNINQDLKEKLEYLLLLNSELQYFAYAPYKELKNRKLRIQVWPIAFQQRIMLKECFGDKVKGAINMHTHGMNSHLCEHIEIAVDKKFSLIEISMEQIERQFTYLNKLTSNKHENSLANTYLKQGRINLLLNKDFHRERTGKNTNTEYIEEWTKQHKWRTQKLKIDTQVLALLNKMKKYGYKENQDWFIQCENNSQFVVFTQPTNRVN